jgi:hypothetical protein
MVQPPFLQATYLLLSEAHVFVVCDNDVAYYLDTQDLPAGLISL